MLKCHYISVLQSGYDIIWTTEKMTKDCTEMKTDLMKNKNCTEMETDLMKNNLICV